MSMRKLCVDFSKIAIQLDWGLKPRFPDLKFSFVVVVSTDHCPERNNSFEHTKRTFKIIIFVTTIMVSTEVQDMPSLFKNAFLSKVVGSYVHYFFLTQHTKRH